MHARSAPLLVLLTALTLAAGCSARASTTPGRIAAKTAARDGIRYQAARQTGIRGWTTAKGSGRWSPVDDQIVYNPSSQTRYGVIFAPYRTTRLRNYAVVARMRLLPESAPLTVMGIVFRCSRNDAASGLRVGLVSEGADSSFVQLWQAGPSLTDGTLLARATFDPGSAWHTYRVEVRGAKIALLVDSKPVLTASSTASMTGRQLGLFANDAAAVSLFQVIAL